MGNTIPDMTSRRSPAGVGTPRGSILQEFLETFDQGRVPTPSPNALLTELGLDPNRPGLSTDLLLSQRELMMRSLLVGSISAAQRAQIVNADVVIGGPGENPWEQMESEVTTKGPPITLGCYSIYDKILNYATRYKLGKHAAYHHCVKDHLQHERWLV